MATFLSLLPIYIFGNLHCLGMCGPLVMMIGQHQYRFYYFLGRVISYSLAGMIAGELGAVLNVVLNHYQIASTASFLFGGIIFLLGLQSLFGWKIPGYQAMARKMMPLTQSFSTLILNDKKWHTFWFGFLTVALPCGQTLIVFTACALSGSAWVGLFNGCALAILTSPSLWFAMNAHAFLRSMKQYTNVMMGLCAIIVGILAFCRGLAEVGLIPHLVLNPQTSSPYHIVIY